MSSHIHPENPPKHLCPGRSTQIALVVFLFILPLGLARDAAAYTWLATSSYKLKFGSVSVGSNSTLGVTLTNKGSSSVTISQATVTGAGFSTNGLVLPLTLNAGQNATFNVEFAPAVGGSVSGSVAIVSTAWDSTLTISLSGSGVAAPIASLSPSNLTFASQALGTSSGAKAVMLMNSGGTALSISSIALTGANPSDFAQTNTCGSSVAAGGNCTISVTFTPTACGTRTATVTVTDNATGSPQSVSLSGTGGNTGAAASLSPISLTFSSQTVGTSSAAQTITLNNTGSASLSISSIALTGTNPSDFTQTNTCGSSVAAGGNCTISVTFTPAVTGTLTAAVTLSDNAAGSPQSVSLSGTGGNTGAVASLSPSSLNFGNEPVDTATSSQTVTLTNTGGAALNITSIAFTGADPTDFTETNTCGSSVAAGGTCTIAILFTPPADGARAASLSITDNASGSPQSAALSGTGTDDVILAWTASATPGVVGYNVYRGTTSGGESPTPINSAAINGATYVDVNVTAGVTYYYMVTAIASDDVTQSADSIEASATVP